MATNDILAMFDFARKGGDAVTNGLAQMQNYLKVENGINKNFQDALTFNDGVAAINALNQYNAYLNQENLKKAQGESSNLYEMMKYAYDPVAGRYRHDGEMAQMAAENGLGDNPYAVFANMGYGKKGLETLGNALSPYDPVAASVARNRAGLYGGYAPNVSQGKDGVVSVGNSSGYVRELTPLAGYLHAQNAAGLNAKEFEFKRDDTVAARDNNYRLNNMTVQADLNNRLAQMQSAREQGNWKERFGMEQSAAEKKAQNLLALEQAKHDYSVKLEAEKQRLKQQGRKDGVEAVLDMDTAQKIYNAARAAGATDVEARAELAAFGREMNAILNGGMQQQNGGANVGTNAIDAVMSSGGDTGKATAAAAQPNATIDPARANLPKIWELVPNSRFGSYGFLPEETRDRQIATRQAAIDYYTPLLESAKQNARNPKSSPKVRNLETLLNRMRRELDAAQKMSDEQYFKDNNEIESVLNWIWYGDVLGGE